MRNRRSGILMHITSLPSRYGIGDLGPGAYRFADFLVESGQCLWQVLPLNPPYLEHSNSPYNSYSAFAGNTLLISPELLVRDGFLKKSDILEHPQFSQERIDYMKVSDYKEHIFQRTYETNRNSFLRDSEFEKFCYEHAYWLDDYALFRALRKNFGGSVWSEWPENLREKEGAELKQWKVRLRDSILMESFLQFIFFKQWTAFKNYCNSNNIHIIGDIPIYVHYDSSDVWTHPWIFKLNQEKYPLFVAGVPPDYFSATGQLWGNPVYNWDLMKENGYSWWIQRLEHNLKLFDITRIDHFRGFVGYWEVNADENTALNGKWVEAPAKDFFTKLLRHFTSFPIIAEDLGVITPDVREIMNTFGFPGMKLLLFAFGDDDPDHPYLPHNYTENCVVYTGTHDNNTTIGWFRKEAGTQDKTRIVDYLGHTVTERDIHWNLIRLALSSIARTAIIPMQDILGLGEEGRMNNPSTTRGNYEWRVRSQQLTSHLSAKLFALTRLYGRTV